MATLTWSCTDSGPSSANSSTVTSSMKDDACPWEDEEPDGESGEDSSAAFARAPVGRSARNAAHAASTRHRDELRGARRGGPEPSRRLAGGIPASKKPVRAVRMVTKGCPRLNSQRSSGSFR